MGVVAERDEERSVRVGGDPTRPRRPAGQRFRTGERLQRDGIDAFDPTRRIGPELVPEQEDLSRFAEHGHRRAERFA